MKKYDATRVRDFLFPVRFKPPFTFLMFITISAVIGHSFSGYLNVRSNWWK